MLSPCADSDYDSLHEIIVDIVRFHRNQPEVNQPQLTVFVHAVPRDNGSTWFWKMFCQVSGATSKCNIVLCNVHDAVADDPSVSSNFRLLPAAVRTVRPVRLQTYTYVLLNIRG